MAQKKQSNPRISPFVSTAKVSPFLGIGEGKAKAAKAALIQAQAAADIAKQNADALQKIATMEAQSKIDSAKLLQSQQDLEAMKEQNSAASGSKTWYIIGGIIAALMIGLYFIVKARRK